MSGQRLSASVALFALIMVAGLSTVDAAEPPNRKGIEFFEAKIRPVLVKRCYECHSEASEKAKGGLLLDTRQGIRNGGESGHAVVPRDIDNSLIISALRHEDFEMPPKEMLPEAVIANFERWIKMGAPDPRAGRSKVAQKRAGVEEGREFWSFQTPTRHEPPQLKDKSWPRDAIDRFVLAKLEEAQLKPVKDANRVDWIRRVTFDLVGLPPTPAEVDDFVQDKSPQARERLVDRLLASPHFGERWGRHWLDVARYAESVGRTRNYPFPYAWRYRDYVIRSLNRDKRYDRFVQEQLAGDLLPAETPAERDEQQMATAFLALGSHDLNQNDAAVFEMDVVSEQIDVTSRGIMAITLACARCHDHKFDPIPTVDYYAMAGIFRSSELLNGYQSKTGGGNRQGRTDRLISLQTVGSKHTAVNGGEKQKSAEKAASKAATDLQRIQKQIRELRAERTRIPAEIAAAQKDRGLDAEQRRTRATELRKQQQQTGRQLQKLAADLRRVQKAAGGRGSAAPDGPYAMGVRDGKQIADCRVNVRGDAHQLGDAVPRGFLQVTAVRDIPDVPADRSGRLELAKWITRPDHPLTSRVIVNRVWYHLFGRGLVRTVDNFGRAGESPSHPELLDHLAVDFVEDGWSLKRLIRRIVLSRTYGLSSQSNEQNYSVDPDNVLLWRMNRRRLEVEAIRDALLAVSGQLNRTPPGGSAVTRYKSGEIGKSGANTGAGIRGRSRSVYLPVVRNNIPEMFTTFDFAEPSEMRGSRDVTTVAPQALFMMNSPFVIEQARHAAEQLLDEVTSGNKNRVAAAYRSALGRHPTEEQQRRVVQLVDELVGDKDNKGRLVDAWAAVYHALFASAEFRYLP